ncbi:MAG: sodium:proton antiporter [Candidatus Moraniibacteriota bacterium]|nr:MAG: sodium:proton antiporter [Candidatus Moranbacteria bacterium]
MTFTLPALLSVFSLLAISSAVFFLSSRLKFPYTVLLVAVGTFILVPLSTLSPFTFLREFTLTPELLLYVFLPILIFESAYNIDIRRLFENIRSIGALSIISLLLSAGFISLMLFLLFPLVGLQISFLLCFLFGALISATDPVAVLALFKEVGAPRRLTLLFEGESIFNDGTAVALFLVVLGIAEHGWHGSESILWGVLDFSVMVFGGIILGIIISAFFVKAIDHARSNEFVQIALMIVLAHFTFLLSDYISEHFFWFGHHFHLSAIISTTIASMVIGNYGRAKILPHAQEFVEKFWTESAFLANSLVFLLIGFIFAALPISLLPFSIPIIIAVLVVAVARAFSIYPVVWILNKMKKEDFIPFSWQHLLAWGSLRGALAITMVLLIPDDLYVSGWSFESTPKEFILALTIGCIFTTLFLKATTITWLARKLNIGSLSEMEKLEYQEANALLHLQALERIERFSKKGYIEPSTANVLKKEHKEKFKKACSLCVKKLETEDTLLGERILRLYAIGVERETLDTLYDFSEVNERVYRRVLAKLTLQYERTELGNQEIDPSEEIIDPISRLFHWISGMLNAKKRGPSTEDRYLYYRTQTILSRAVLRALRHMDEEHAPLLFGKKSFVHIREIYEIFLAGSQEKMKAVTKEISEEAKILSERFARRSLLETESRLLEELFHRSMMTPKVYIALKENIERESDVVLQ